MRQRTVRIPHQFPTGANYKNAKRGELHKITPSGFSDPEGVFAYSVVLLSVLLFRILGRSDRFTEEKLRMIDHAEQFLIELGFFAERVRLHGKIARIEVPPEDIQRLASEEVREPVYAEFRRLGFLFVTLDLKGYRTGSMNLTLEKNG